MTTTDRILKIMALCLEINPPEIENVGKKKTAVFFEWSPHCNVVTLSIHCGGWERGVPPHIVERCFVDSNPEKLDEMAELLERIGVSEIG